LGLAEKKCQFSKKQHITMGASVSFAVKSRVIQGLERSVSFMCEVTDGLTAATLPVCLNK